MEVSQPNICSYGPGVTTKDCRATPQLQNWRTRGALEDPRTYFTKLLVAQHVMIHQSVLQSLRYVSSDEGPKVQTIW
jgi:hypothetical protein